MRRVSRSFVLGLVTVLVGLADVAFGQVPDSAKALTATLVGHVVDTAGGAVADAEVLVTRSGDGTVVSTAKSDKRGNAIFRRLPAGVLYTIVARKFGYGAARGEVRLGAGDTLYVDFELPVAAVTLAPITVKSRRNRYSISADQFNPKLYRDALSLLVQQRRDMLGDPEQCPLPDPLLGGPGRDSVSRLKLGRFTFSNDKRRLKDIGQRPWLDSLRYHSAITVPDLPYVQQVYVNGVRVDWPKVRSQRWVTDSTGQSKLIEGLFPVPGRSVVEALRDIPTDQIGEIRYVDCWDRSVPFYKQYALYVTLKPPSREVQDSILRSITKRDSVSR